MNCPCCGQPGVATSDANGALARVWWCHTLECPVNSFVAAALQKPVEELVEEPMPKETRGRRRWKAFLHADCGLKFGEWLKTDWAKEVR